MRKLPEGEAKRRENVRNDIKNKTRKANRRANLLTNGIPIYKTPEQKRETVRLNQIKRRVRQRETRLLTQPFVYVENTPKRSANRKGVIKKVITVKPVKIAKTVVIKPMPTILRKESKQQPEVVIIPVTPSDHKSTWIPELRMHVFLRPGKTVADMIVKYKK